MKRTLWLLGIVLMLLLLTGTALAATDAAKVGSTPYATLALAFQNASSGDTITLLRDLTMADWSNTIKFSKSLTLDGDGHKITIDRDYTYYLFTVINANNDFTVKNLTIEGAAVNADWDYSYTRNTTGGKALSNIIVTLPSNCVAVTTGGLITSASKLTLQSCTIQNIIKTGNSALIMAKAGLVFDDVKLQKNYSKLVYPIYAAGAVSWNKVDAYHNGLGGKDGTQSINGGLMTYAGSLSVTNSSLKENMSGMCGGCFYSNKSDNITFRNSTFQNNICGEDGGVGLLYPAGNQNVDCIIDKCLFTENKGLAIHPADPYSSYGGSLCIHSSITDPYTLTVTCTNTDFTKNESYAGAGIGIVTISPAKVKFDQCKFEQNGYATEHITRGTGIEIYGKTDNPNNLTDLQIINCSFTNNITGFGTIRIGPMLGKCLIDTCTFSGNQAYQGAAVYTYDTPLNIAMKNCTIKDNTANNSTALYYGSSMDGAKFTIDACDIYNNTATSGNGIVTIYTGKTSSKPVSLSVNNTNIHHNSVTKVGGGIYAYDAYVTLGAGTMIHHNYAGQYGGGVSVSAYVFDSSFTMEKGSQIYHNTAGIQADDIRFATSAGLNLDYSLIKPGKICQVDGCEKFHEYLKRYETDTKGKEHKPFGPLTGTLSNGQTANIRVVPAIVPSTGDNMPIALIACLLLLSAAGVCVMVRKKAMKNL